ncbi:conjugal transfer protein TrbN [Burkholderia sp. BCC0044]|uniref:conjugal transfer protein TrbN n=1 Tax=Burkholderia sp. BCC0044 TaxID=2676295 RepID=UPI001ABBD66A|nr:conjugal transfer protein TrbN [Burkholderia sp. BCC0044]
MSVPFCRRSGASVGGLLFALTFPVWTTHAADMPTERITCSIAAAVRYQIPVNAMLAVAEQEGGRPGLRMRNANGTYDVGAMQMNTAYLKELKRFGIEERDVAGPGCYPYHLAAWRLRRHVLDDRGDIWTRIANYHSRTPVYNARYRAAIIKRATRWATWLKARYPTYVAY